MTRATLDDLARGHVVPAIDTPLLDALAAQPDERRRAVELAPVAIDDRAPKLDVDALLRDLRDARTELEAQRGRAHGATVRANATQRLLDAARARADGLDRQLMEAWAIIRELRGEPATVAVNDSEDVDRG